MPPVFVRVNRGEEKIQGEDDAPDKTKKKRDKKPKSKKPYPVKRPSKIKHLDPIFIGKYTKLLAAMSCMFVKLSTLQGTST